MVLQALGCGHPDGIEILLTALVVPRARFPPEVYNRDENELPLTEPDDRRLSELARGLRYARRKSAREPFAEAERYRGWLANAMTIHEYISRGMLVVEALKIEDVPVRDSLVDEYGIGVGEAAGLTLAMRESATAIFVSSDEHACKTAQTLGIPYLTIPDILDRWIDRSAPTKAQFDELIDGMSNVRFALNPTDREHLTAKLRS